MIGYPPRVPTRRTKRRAQGSAIQAGVALSIAASEIACSHGSAPETPAPTVIVTQTAASVEAPPPPPEPPAAIAALRPYALVHPRAARGVLYTWTTAEQLAQLRRDR